MPTVFNGEYQNFSTGASGGWGLKDVEIELNIPTDLSGSEPGKVYYIKSEDTLIMEIPSQPYYQILAGGILGWSYDFNILTGGDTVGSSDNEFLLYSTIPLNEDEGYNNVDVYKNGLLMENAITGDYVIEPIVGEEEYKIIFNYDVEDTDRLVVVISLRPSLNNYVTKHGLKEFMGNVTMDIAPSETLTYNIGSNSSLFNDFYIKNINGPESDKLVLKGDIEIIGNLKVEGVEHTSSDTNLTDESLVIHYSDIGVDGTASFNVRRAPRVEGNAEKTEIIIPSDENANLDGTFWTLSNALNFKRYYIWYYILPEPASVIGSNSLSSGYDWTNYNKNFNLTINSVSYTISLTENLPSITDIVNKLNNIFTDNSILVEAFNSSGYLGLRTLETGSDQTFLLTAGSPDALGVFGLTEGTSTGSDGEYSYEEINLGNSVISTNESGLIVGNTYDLSISIGSDIQDLSLDFIDTQPAKTIGNVSLSSGYDWSSNPETFNLEINSDIAYDEVILNQNLSGTDITTVTDAIQTAISDINLDQYIEAYNDGTHIGFRLKTGINGAFSIIDGSTALGVQEKGNVTDILGTNDVSGGYDWSSNTESIIISYHSDVITDSITLDQNISDTTSAGIVSDINTGISDNNLQYSLGAEYFTKHYIGLRLKPSIDGTFIIEDVIGLGISSQSGTSNVLGNNDISNGYDWSSNPETFNININSTGDVAITLNNATTDIQTTIDEVNTALTSAGIDDMIEVYDVVKYYARLKLNDSVSGSFDVSSINGIHIPQSDRATTVESVNDISDGFDWASSSETIDISYRENVSSTLILDQNHINSSMIDILNYINTVLESTSANSFDINNITSLGITSTNSISEIIGTNDVSSGFDWASNPETINLNINDSGTKSLTLNTTTTTLTEAVVAINTELGNNNITRLEAFDDGSNHIGFRFIDNHNSLGDYIEAYESSGYIGLRLKTGVSGDFDIENDSVSLGLTATNIIYDILGEEYILAGVDWTNYPETMYVGTTNELTLNTTTTDIAGSVNELNTLISSLGLDTDIEAFDDGSNHIGLRLTSGSSEIGFSISAISSLGISESVNVTQIVGIEDISAGYSWGSNPETFQIGLVSEVLLDSSSTTVANTDGTIDSALTAAGLDSDIEAYTDGNDHIGIRLTGTSTADGLSTTAIEDLGIVETIGTSEVLGTTTLTLGYDWASNPESLNVVYHPVTTGSFTLSNDRTDFDANNIVSMINTKLSVSEVSDYIEAYLGNNYQIGFRSKTDGYFYMSRVDTLGIRGVIETDNVTGDRVMSVGHDWSSNNEIVDFSYFPKELSSDITLDQDLSNQDVVNVVAMLENKILETNLDNYIEVYNTGNYIGFKLKSGISGTFNVSEIVGIGISSTLDATNILGTKYMGGGYNWGVNNQSFYVSVNGGTETEINLVDTTTDLSSTITLINDIFSLNGITEIEAFGENGFMGIRTVNVGSSETFTLNSGPSDALKTIGLEEGTYNGSDAEATTYQAVVDKLNIETTDATWTINNGNIRLTADSWGSDIVSIQNGTTNDLVTNLNNIQSPNFINSYTGFYASPAEKVGSTELLSGFDFRNKNEVLTINNIDYLLTTKTTSLSETITLVDGMLPEGLEAFSSNSYLGLRTLETGYEQTFTINNGNTSLGISAGTYNGAGMHDPTVVDPEITDYGVRVDINRDNSGNSNAIATMNELNTLSDFNVTILGATLTITNTEIGYSDDAADGTTGISVNVLTPGDADLYHEERDAKIVWNDNTHLWQLKYGENGDISSNIVTEADGNAPTATKILNSRTFEITGDGTADPVSFNGTDNVVLNINVHDDSHDHATSITGSASRLTTPRTISVTGDLTGNALFDGSSNISIQTTVNKVEGVNFHQDATDPTGTTRLNMDGYFYATRVYNAVYNDLAEFMDKAEETSPGDVVVQTKDGLIKSQKRADIKAIGVHSDTYGYALGAEDQENKIPVGISGTVWVKIDGKFKIGDMVVSHKNGKAIKANLIEKLFKRDALIGKILKDNKENDRVKILIKN